MADATGSTPIVSPDALRRIRRPGARRRLAVVVFFLLVIAVAVATYVVLSRRIGRVDPLSEYTVATVRSGPLVERVSIAGSVRMARDEVARAPRAGTVAETYRIESYVTSNGQSNAIQANARPWPRNLHSSPRSPRAGSLASSMRVTDSPLSWT